MVLSASSASDDTSFPSLPVPGSAVGGGGRLAAVSEGTWMGLFGQHNERGEQPITTMVAYIENHGKWL